MAASTTVDLKSILDVIDSTLADFDFGVGLDTILTGLCMIAIIYHFGKITVDNLINPSNAFSFDAFKKPVFYVIMLVAWPQLYHFILDASNGMAETIVAKNQLVMDANDANYKKMNALLVNIEKTQAKAAGFDNESDWYDKVLLTFQTLDDKILIAVFQGFYKMTIYFDAFLYLIFYFITKFYLKFVLMGGGIAFTMSLFVGWTNLIHWAKTVVSVSLWIPVTAIAMQLINTILLKVISGQLETTLAINNLATFNDPVTGMFSGEAFMAALVDALVYGLVITVIFIGLKIVVLSKVPAIIGTWVSGGGGLGAGFAGGFIPVAMAGMAAKAGGGAAAGAASKMAKSLKKPENPE